MLAIEATARVNMHCPSTVSLGWNDRQNTKHCQALLKPVDVITIVCQKCERNSRSVIGGIGTDQIVLAITTLSISQKSAHNGVKSVRRAKYH